MTVAISILIFLVICLIFASENFFMAMLIFSMLFLTMEVVWWLYYGETISALFWRWRRGQVGWKRNAAPMAMVLLAVYLAGHLLEVWP